MSGTAATLEQHIRRRTYELWEAAGSPSGQDEHFWFLAENDVAASKDASADTTGNVLMSGPAQLGEERASTGAAADASTDVGATAAPARRRHKSI